MYKWSIMEHSPFRSSILIKCEIKTVLRSQQLSAQNYLKSQICNIFVTVGFIVEIGLCIFELIFPITNDYWSTVAKNWVKYKYVIYNIKKTAPNTLNFKMASNNFVRPVFSSRNIHILIRTFLIFTLVN